MQRRIPRVRRTALVLFPVLFGSPRTEIICEEPMLTVDRQMGLNIVHSDGKVIF